MLGKNRIIIWYGIPRKSNSESVLNIGLRFVEVEHNMVQVTVDGRPVGDCLRCAHTDGRTTRKHNSFGSIYSVEKCADTIGTVLVPWAGHLQF